MKTIEIKGTARVAGGKKAAKQLRKQGVIPCNLYGELKDEKGLPKAVSFSVTEAELRKREADRRTGDKANQNARHQRYLWELHVNSTSCPTKP